LAACACKNYTQYKAASNYTRKILQYLFGFLFAHSMCKFRILFQNSSNFVVRFLFLKITQNLLFFFKLRESIFEKALFKINQKSFKTLMGFVPKLRVWFVPKSPNLGFVPKVPKFPEFLPPYPSKSPNLGFLSKVPKLPVCGRPNSQGWFRGP
jgi:hypothetical protein